MFECYLFWVPLTISKNLKCKNLTRGFAKIYRLKNFQIYGIKIPPVNLPQCCIILWYLLRPMDLLIVFIFWSFYLFLRIALARQERLKQATINKSQGGLWGMISKVTSGSGSSESILWEWRSVGFFNNIDWLVDGRHVIFNKYVRS